MISTQVERGADINTVDRAGMNPLFAPCFSDDLRAVDALLKVGADPHLPFLFFGEEVSPAARGAAKPTNEVS